MANASLTNASLVKTPSCYSKGYSASFLERYLRITHSVIAPMNSVAFILSTALNVLILLTVIKQSRLRTPSTLLLCSIVVKDLLIVSILQPVAVYRSSQFLLTENFCNKTPVDGIRPFTVFLYRCISLTTWVVVSLDRWIAIRRPAIYRSVSTKKRAYMCIAAIWVFSVVLSCLATWVMNKAARYLLVFIHFGLVSVLISTVQISVYRSIKSHINTVGAVSSEQARQTAIERRIAGTVAYSVIAVAVIYVPIITVSLIRFLGRNLFLMTSPWLEMLMLSNAAVNPIIWLKTSHQLRKALRAIIWLPSLWSHTFELQRDGTERSTAMSSTCAATAVSTVIQSAWKIESTPRRQSMMGISHVN